MPQEIERKFLLHDAVYRQADLWGREPRRARSGYLSLSPEVRISVMEGEGASYLTIKGEGSLVRDEFEWEAGAHGEALLAMCHYHRVEKTRYYLPAFQPEAPTPFTWWEIDVFHGSNEGLVVVELELPDPHTPFVRPPWLGREITGVRRFYNAQLAQKPFCIWTPSEKALARVRHA